MEKPYRANRHRQVLKSTRHYLSELRALRSPAELYGWFQYKLPYLFPIPAFPPRVTLELTNRCNFACRHCHRTVMNRELGSMDYHLLQKIVAEVSAHPDCRLKIGGLGEPSLYKLCSEFMRSLKDSGVESIFYTNGSLLWRFNHDEVLEWQLRHLVVSVDGTDRQSYEGVRIGGDYDRLRAALQQFRSRRTDRGDSMPWIEVRHVILPEETDAQLAEFSKAWAGLSDTVMFNHVIPSGPINAERPSRRCRDIRRELYVRWNGKVPVCGYQYLVGEQEWLADLSNSTIENAWRHSLLRQRRTMHLRGAAAIPGYCAVCSQTA